MDLKIILGVIALSVLVFIIGVFIPSGKVTHKQSLPWQIEQTADGSSRVFGLVLGQSNLHEAEKSLRDVAEVSLFATEQESGDTQHIVEAYFDKVKLGGLSARVVLEMEIPVSVVQNPRPFLHFRLIRPRRIPRMIVACFWTPGRALVQLN